MQPSAATCSQSASVKEAPANLQSLNVQRVNAALSNMLLEKLQPSKAMSTKSAPVKSQLRPAEFDGFERSAVGIAENAQGKLIERGSYARCGQLARR